MYAGKDKPLIGALEPICAISENSRVYSLLITRISMISFLISKLIVIVSVSRRDASPTCWGHFSWGKHRLQSATRPILTDSPKDSGDYRWRKKKK